MDSVEAEGNSIDEAIENALRQLGVARDRVEIEILSNSARGLFGLGGRKARVRATRRRPIDADDAEAAEPTPDVRAEHHDPAPLETHPRPDSPLPAEPNGLTGTEAHGPGIDAAMAEQGIHVLREIVRLLGVDADVQSRHEDDCLVLELTGDTSGVLIGRRGQMLDALEYVVNRIVSRDHAPERIVVDSQNYRARRRASLEELARRMGEQAKKKRKAMTLNPMSPRDRRIVHLVLQADPSLSTKSSGKGYFRKLVIIPTGAGRSARGDGPRSADPRSSEQSGRPRRAGDPERGNLQRAELPEPSEEADETD